MLYFKKENLRNPVYGPDKKAVQFEPVAGETGVIVLDEAKSADLIKLLQEHADKRRLGVVRVSAEIYDTLKKNAVSHPSRKPSVLNQMRVAPSPLNFNERLNPAVARPAEAGRNTPIRVMEEPGPPSSIAAFRQTGIRSRSVSQTPPESNK